MDSVMLEHVATAERPRLLGIAYRMTGSYSDAEDIVQDTMLRIHRAAPAEIESPAAYLTTVTTRLAIDHLRSARVRRESYVGPWLPEPIVADPAPDAVSRAVVSDSISIAFLLMLETLSPDERAVLVLHDVFAYTHGEIATMLERSEGSCRLLLLRARQRLQAGRSRIDDVDPAKHDEVVRRFVAACDGGDFDAFFQALVSDVELVFDGGPDVTTAARHPIRGADRVARFLAYVMNRLTTTRRVEATTLNGGPAVFIHAQPGGLIGAVFIEPSTDDRAAIIRWVRNPSKLNRLR
jgi:RNA polymerase sigma-70 factor (ECF subfamily)